MPVDKLSSDLQTKASTHSAAVELKKPQLNAWSAVAETRLPRQVMSEVHERKLGNADVMLVGPNEFVIGAKAGGPGVHVFKDDPDDFNAAFKVEAGTIAADGSFEPARAAQAEERREPTANTVVVGDTTGRDSGTRQPIGGGMSVRLGANTGVLFSELPKAVQGEIKAHIEQHNALQKMSMSPQKLEFVRAEEKDGAFDVTFAVRNWMGALDGEQKGVFGKAAPVTPTAPTATGGAITSLDQLPASTRAAITQQLTEINEGESMSMSPKTYSFVSATPMTGGAFEVTLNAKGMFGDSDDVKMKLGADGRWG